MPEALLIDSSVFMSSLLDHEENSTFSRSFMAEIVEKNIRIVIPMLVVFEIVHILKKNSVSVDDNFLQLFFLGNSIKILDLDEQFLRNFVSNLNNTVFKTADAIIVSAADTQNIPLVTWDKQILKHYKASISPQDWLESQKK